MWVIPSESDILTRISGPELEAFRSAALADGQGDPVARQITIVVDFMRGYLMQGCRFAMAGQAAGSIPAEGLHIFLDLIVPVIEKRPVGAVIDVSGIRLDARKDAINWLKWAAECPKSEGTNVGELNTNAARVPTFNGPKHTRRSW